LGFKIENRTTPALSDIHSGVIIGYPVTWGKNISTPSPTKTAKFDGKYTGLRA